MKHFLKRFECLENKRTAFVGDCPRIRSRRFECLEVNDTAIAVAITDTISREETAPETIRYHFLCAYCGRENPVNADNCTYCKQPLQTEFNLEYQRLAKNFTRCECGTMNQLPRKCCWLCGKRLATSQKQEGECPENVITITFEGKEYSSNESYLPREIRALMDRIRKQGYSKEVVEEWARQRKETREKQTISSIEFTREQLRVHRTRLYMYLIAAAAGLLIFALRMIFLP